MDEEGVFMFRLGVGGCVWETISLSTMMAPAMYGLNFDEHSEGETDE